MGRTACIEPQCLYKGALHLHPPYPTYSKEQINTFKVIRILCCGLTVQYLIQRVAHSSVYNHITQMSVTNPYRYTYQFAYTPTVIQLTADFLVFGVHVVCPADMNRRHYVNRQITSPGHARVSIPYQSSSLNSLKATVPPYRLHEST
jgi:hypothetical protein